MDIAIHMIVIALILDATFMIYMIAENVIASQLLVTARAKVTMPNIKANLDRDHDHDQVPVLVILEAQDTTMVITYVIMTPGEGNGHACLFPSLAQDWNVEHSLLKPNLLLFYVEPQSLN